MLGGFLRGEDHASEALEALVGLADRDDSAGAAADAIAARLDDDPRIPTPTRRDADRRARHAASSRVARRAWCELVVASSQRPGRRGEAIAPAALDRTARDPGRSSRSGAGAARWPHARAVPRRARARPFRMPRAQSRSSQSRAHRAGARRRRRPRRRAAARALLGDRDPTVRVAGGRGARVARRVRASRDARRARRRVARWSPRARAASRARPRGTQAAGGVPTAAAGRKAGEPGEQQRALLALGSLGDRRALDQLVAAARSRTRCRRRDARAAAGRVEALGRLLPALTDDDAADARGRLERLALGGVGPARLRAFTGLRYAQLLGIVETVAADREAPVDVRDACDRPSSGSPGAVDQRDRCSPICCAIRRSRSPTRRKLRSHASCATIARASACTRSARRTSRSARAPRSTSPRPAMSPTLVERLGSVDDADVRAMFREGLVRRGELPRAQLEVALRGADPRPRAEAAWIAGYGGATAGSLADAVVAAAAARRCRLARRGWWCARRRRRSSPTKPRRGTRAVGRRARRRGQRDRRDRDVALGDERPDQRPTCRRHVRSRAVLVRARSHRAIGDADREVRAVAALAVAARQPERARELVRRSVHGPTRRRSQPLAAAAWPGLAPS